MSDIKDHVVIPVKPTLVTAANGVALTAAAVATAGAGAAALIVGGVVVTGAAVKGAGAAKKAAARRSSTSAAGKSAASSMGGKRAAGRSGASGSGIGGGKAAGRGLLARMAGKKGAASKKAAAGSGSKGTVYGGSASKGAGSKGTAAAGKRGGGSGKVSPFRSSGKRGAAAGPRSTSGASRSPLTRAAKWGGGKVSGAARRAVGLPADGPKKKGDIRRAGFKKARGWFQRNIMGKKKVAPKRAEVAAKNVTPTVKRAPVSAEVATGIIGPLTPGAIIAGRMPEYLTSNAPHSTTHSSGGTMKHYATQMADYAAEYDAPGVLEIIEELDANLYDSLKLVAEAFDSLSATARNKWPFDQAIGQKLSMISECLWTGSNIARDIVPDIESIHKKQLDDLRNPAVGQGKFDLSANGKA